MENNQKYKNISLFNYIRTLMLRHVILNYGFREIQYL